VGILVAGAGTWLPDAVAAASPLLPKNFCFPTELVGIDTLVNTLPTLEKGLGLAGRCIYDCITPLLY
jgi:hypothetical protein